SVGDVDLVVEDNRSADQLVARLRPYGVLRIAIELPELLSRRRVIASHPAVALAVNHLNHVTDLADRRRRPLAMQDAISHGVVFPNLLASFLVDRNEGRSFRRRNIDVALILTVRGADVNHISERDR